MMDNEQENAGTGNSHRNRNIIIGVIVAVIVIALVCFLVIAHPWDSGAQTNSEIGSGNAVNGDSQTYSETDSDSAVDTGSDANVTNGSGEAMEIYWDDSLPVEESEITGLLTSYGVADGSAGPDFMGISNTNFDFTEGDVDSKEQFVGYDADYLHDITGAGIAIWATSVNENPNPYYANLFYNIVMGNVPTTQTARWLTS